MKKCNDIKSYFQIIWILFILRPTTGEVRHKAFFKVGPDAGPQPTRFRQIPKITSAPSAPLKGGDPDARNQKPWENFF